MNLSSVFIARPVATTLLSLGVALAGVLSYRLLPVAPLPQVDYPAISVQASLPGASPETMAATVATPLETYLPQSQSGRKPDAHHRIDFAIVFTRFHGGFGVYRVGAAFVAS